MRVGDTAPNLVLTLTDDGSPVDLTGSQISVILESGVKTVTKSATGSSDGVLVLLWNDGDTDTAGIYNGRVRVTFSDGKVQTWPAQGNFFVTIHE